MVNETIYSEYKLRSILIKQDIPDHFLNTPYETLLMSHNLGEKFQNFDRAQLLIIMCMDNRNYLRLPVKFAYIIRTAGARITGNEFQLSFAIGYGDIKHIAIITHTMCGMVKVTGKKEKEKIIKRHWMH